MTINIQLATVADSISGISISGVNVKDIDQIPENAMSILPVLFPSPDGFITDMTFERISQNVGGGGTALQNVSYTMNYRFLHSVVGSGGGLLATYADFIAKLELILEAIFASDAITGQVDFTLQGISNIGPMTDPAGKTSYHGVDLHFRVLEFVQ